MVPLSLTGTCWLFDSEMYPEKLTARGLACAPERRRARGDQPVVMDELVYGVRTPEVVACFQRVIGGMRDEGYDAVVLGCTEIPLIVDDSSFPLPTLDSTRLLARVALRRAVQGAAMPA